MSAGEDGGKCSCGEPLHPDLVVHRTDGPCYMRSKDEIFKEQQSAAKSVKPCPYHGDPNAMEFSSASKQYAACMKCSTDPARGVWYRPIESWNNAWGHRQIAELDSYGKYMEKINTEAAAKIAELEKRVAAQNERLEWMIGDDLKSKDALEHKLKEAVERLAKLEGKGVERCDSHPNMSCMEAHDYHVTGLVERDHDIFDLKQQVRELTDNNEFLRKELSKPKDSAPF